MEAGEKALLKDAALSGVPAPENGYAPAFQVDWKDPHRADACFGVVEPHRELRVRNQIETESRRALDANLFAYRMLAPRARKPDGSFQEFEWLAEIDFGGVTPEKRVAVQEQLAGLLRVCGLPASVNSRPAASPAAWT